MNCSMALESEYSVEGFKEYLTLPMCELSVFRANSVMTFRKEKSSSGKSHSKLDRVFDLNIRLMLQELSRWVGSATQFSTDFVTGEARWLLEGREGHRMSGQARDESISLAVEKRFQNPTAGRTDDARSVKSKDR